jgi:hypothetical protein
MNERIKELAEQAGFIGKGFQNTVMGTCQETALENFAELIVRDCAEAALAKGRASPDTDFRTGSYVISEYLLSRYGVE